MQLKLSLIKLSEADSVWQVRAGDDGSLNGPGSYLATRYPVHRRGTHGGLSLGANRSLIRWSLTAESLFSRHSGYARKREDAVR